MNRTLALALALALLTCACENARFTEQVTVFTIDTRGGTATSADNKVRVEFHRDALPGPIEIRIRVDEDDPPRQAASATYQLEPEDLTFPEKSVMLRMWTRQMGLTIARDVEPEPEELDPEERAPDELGVHIPRFGRWYLRHNCRPNCLTRPPTDASLPDGS